MISILERDDMSWSLFLDDNRDPKTDRDWKIARSVAEAKHLVQLLGVPEYISFDHDLDENGTGYDFARWLVEQELEGRLRIPVNFDFNVHSANAIGATNIYYYLKGYLKQR